MKILKDVTEDSLELLSSQTENKKNRKLRNMDKVLRKLEKKRKEKRFRGTNELDDTFEKNSQSSLVELIRDEKGVNAKEKEEEKPVKKQKRKPLDKCRNLEYIAEETKKILETIRSEAEELLVTDLQLLSYLLYRVSYTHNRDLAKHMFQLFRSGEWQPGLEPVCREKALALTERCRLGKGGFRYLHRQLKPHGLKMPYYPAVAELRRQACPVLRPYTDMAGRVVGLTAGLLDSLQLTLRRHIQSGQASYLETTDCSLSVGITIGFDGRGEKSEYKQKSQVGIDTSHSLSCQYMVTDISKLDNTETDCLDRKRDPGHLNSDCVVGRVKDSDWKCSGREADKDVPTAQVGAEASGHGDTIKKPFNFQEKDGVVWQEKELGSTWAARPLAIVMQRETRENTVSFVEGYLSREVCCLTSYRALGCSDTAETKLEGSEAGGDWVFYSPRGRIAVSRESCSSLKVVGRTVLQNPMPRQETASPAPAAKRAACEPRPAATPDQALAPPEVIISF